MKASRTGRPRTGKAMPAAERMRRMRERRRAAGLRAQTRWVANDTVGETPAVYSDHRLHDIRSLAMHALIARKLAVDPACLRHARANLRRWRSRFDDAPPRWWCEWDRILRQPWQSVANLLTDSGERPTRLRQSSPFAGVLTATERRRFHEAFRA